MLERILARVEQGTTTIADAESLRQIFSAQESVSRAVRERGYYEGWTFEQFAVRQVCKLAEELGELTHCVRSWHQRPDSENYWVWAVTSAGDDARESFTDGGIWSDGYVHDLEAAKSELADIQVVIFSLADALGQIDRSPFDVVAAAVEKAQADVKRGVRE